LTAAWVWEQLAVGPTRDRAEIRRAYGRRLKQAHPEDDAAAFQRLRQAYELALAQATPDPAAPVAARPNPPAPAAEPDPVDLETRSGTNDPTLEIAPPPVVFGSNVRLAAPARGSKRVDDTVDPGRDLAKDGASRLAELRRAMFRLDATFAGGGPLVPEAIERELEAVLTSGALDNVETYQDVEAWLAGLLSSHIPRSDPFLALASRRFGWENGRPAAYGDAVGEAVVLRLHDLPFLAAIRRPNHELHVAFRALSRPPDTTLLGRLAWSPGLPAQVSKLLYIVRRRHPTIINDLDALSVSAWDARLAKTPRRANRSIIGGRKVNMARSGARTVRLVVFGFWILVTFARLLGAFTGH
jgi:hypothetical protein